MSLGQKVHGGVTKKHIMQHVSNAQKISLQLPDGMKTVLFFDEANTSDAIGLIKEVIIDQTLNGDPLHLDENNLVVIAACNPYRRCDRLSFNLTTLSYIHNYLKFSNFFEIHINNYDSKHVTLSQCC